MMIVARAKHSSGMSRRRLLGGLALGGAAAEGWPCTATALSAAPVRDQDMQDLFNEVEAALLNERFDKLESMASALRDDNNTFAGGYPKLYFFYAALGTAASGDCYCGEEFASLIPLADKQSALEAWMAHTPRSVAAPIAMARFLIDRAWAARGHDFSAQTTLVQKALFAMYMARAGAYLAPLRPADDPAISDGLLTVSEASRNGRAASAAVYEAAVRTFPRYYPYYMTRANLLQTKWFGIPGELALYLRSLVKGDETVNLIGYSFAAERLMFRSDVAPLFRGLGVEWPSLRPALEVRAERYGSSGKLLNVELRLAVGAGDRDFARTRLDQIGGNWDPTVWSNAAAFAAATAWAMGGAPPDRVKR